MTSFKSASSFIMVSRLSFVVLLTVLSHGVVHGAVHSAVVRASADASTPSLDTTHVGEMAFDLKPPQVIDDTLVIYEAVGGNITGNGMFGEVIPPTADWLQLDGPVATNDVRASFMMDDGSLMYVTMTGRGILSETGSIDYLAGSPLFRTSSEKYGFLRDSLYVAQMKEVTIPDEDGFFTIVYNLYQVESTAR